MIKVYPIFQVPFFCLIAGNLLYDLNQHQLQMTQYVLVIRKA
jgi:hypothetical protein